jgi:hypothetical protein
MKQTIEIIIVATGDISIEGVGFKGADCEKATQFIEEALGVVNSRAKKPEFHQQAQSRSKQRIGS